MNKKSYALAAKIRNLTGKKVDKLRKEGKIPAVLYGHKIKPVNLSVDYTVFEKIFNEAGESTLIDLAIEEQKPIKVLIQDSQFNPMTNQIIHVDFYQVKMDEKLHTEIALKLINEAPAVKELSGILVTNLHNLSVECLPGDLVHEIEVNLSSLKTLDDVIHVSDLEVPNGIHVLNPAGDVIVLIQPPRSEKEIADLETKPIEAKPEEKEVTPEEVTEKNKSEE
jgi:large subunit ribosomal protein L25